MSDLDVDSVVVATPDQVSADLDGQAAILHLGTDQYYGLDEIGARIWALIQRPAAVSAVCDALQAEYDVSRADCERDVLALLRDLRAAGLVEVRAT